MEIKRFRLFGCNKKEVYATSFSEILNISDYFFCSGVLIFPLFPYNTNPLFNRRHYRNSYNLRMSFYNRTIKESSHMTGTNHVQKSGNLACVQENMRIDPNSLELSGEGHDLNRVCVKKDQRLILQNQKEC